MGYLKRICIEKCTKNCFLLIFLHIPQWFST